MEGRKKGEEGRRNVRCLHIHQQQDNHNHCLMRINMKNHRTHQVKAQLGILSLLTDKSEGAIRAAMKRADIPMTTEGFHRYLKLVL